jgi:hypothetical protein
MAVLVGMAVLLSRGGFQAFDIFEWGGPCVAMSGFNFQVIDLVWSGNIDGFGYIDLLWIEALLLIFIQMSMNDTVQGLISG